MELIPVEQLPALRAEALRQAEANSARINSKIDFTKFEAKFDRIAGLKIPAKAKTLQMWEVGAEISKAITPYVACKQGCSFCCNIATTITTTEAQIIGKHVGRKPQVFTKRVNILTNIPKYSGVPCPFLKEGRCSIYEVRPLACRIHFNLSDSPYFCNTSIPSKDSIVPQTNNDNIDAAHFKAFHNEIWADMRDFFPTKG